VGNTGTMKRTGRVGRVNVTRKDSRNRECNQPSAAALTNGCAQEKQKTKTKTNVLDGADFVRDVIDTYLQSALRSHIKAAYFEYPVNRSEYAQLAIPEA